MSQGVIRKYFLSNYLDIILSNRDYNLKIIDQADRIIVWIVGFSIASIALILSKRQELNLIYPNLPKIIIVFSLLTIIFGIIYRIIIFITQMLSNNIFIQFQGYIKGQLEPPQINIGRDISENDSYEDILNYLELDFKIKDLFFDLDNYDEDTKKLVRNMTLEYYNSIKKLEKDTLRNELEDIKQIFNEHLGIPIKKLNKIFSSKNNKNKNRIFWYLSATSFYLFLTTTLTFLTGVIIFLINFLNYN